MTGYSPKKYMLLRRIERARFFLTNTNMSISEIAETTGMEDSNSLIRLFRKVTGISPGKFRKNKQWIYIYRFYIAKSVSEKKSQIIWLIQSFFWLTNSFCAVILSPAKADAVFLPIYYKEEHSILWKKKLKLAF